MSKSNRTCNYFEKIVDTSSQQSYNETREHSMENQIQQRRKKIMQLLIYFPDDGWLEFEKGNLTFLKELEEGLSRQGYETLIVGW